jgi:hypothetical protein
MWDSTVISVGMKLMTVMVLLWLMSLLGCREASSLLSSTDLGLPPASCSPCADVQPLPHRLPDFPTAMVLSALSALVVLIPVTLVFTMLVSAMLVSVVDVPTTALSLGLTLPSLPPGQRVIAGGGGLVVALLPEALGVHGVAVKTQSRLAWSC